MAVVYSILLGNRDRNRIRLLGKVRRSDGYTVDQLRSVETNRTVVGLGQTAFEKLVGDLNS